MEGTIQKLVETEVKLIKCPRCDIQTYKYFEYQNTRENITVFKGECNNDHEFYYFISTRAGLSMTYFNYVDKTTFDYKIYLNSQEWKDKSEKVKERAGWKCQLCNASGNSYTLHAHHRTYENIGHEKYSDLIVLCFECHSKFHDKDN